MSDNLDYQDRLARAGTSQFEQLGETLATVASELQAEVGSDNPWSNDKIGSNFASQFDPSRTAAIKNVTDYAAKVNSYAPVLKQAADGVVRTDQA
ncbi:MULTISPECIES: hypothetical protein [Mycolicibacterium]|uniref:hypothetical protein n=1 Tax=Mycolicibacterium TaxID=1866885 RepID=UPI0026346CBD|nr:hypothetical protein [Mycolicibacterium fortuitum]